MYHHGQFLVPANCPVEGTLYRCTFLPYHSIL